VVSEFPEHPLANNRAFGGVMQNVDFPETEQYLSLKRSYINSIHVVSHLLQLP
jgi:hypothetical protein